MCKLRIELGRFGLIITEKCRQNSIVHALDPQRGDEDGHADSTKHS